MKYTPGLLAGQLSGKAGNTVASRNRNGSYFRTRVNPMLVRNVYTTTIRDRFTTNAQAFRELSPAQVRAWNALGAQLIRSNSIGQSSGMTGLQAYNSVNLNSQGYFGVTISDAPEFTAAPDASGTSMNIGYDVAGTATTVTAGATSATQVVGTTAGVRVGDLFTDTDESVSATVLQVLDATHVLLDAVITTVTADDVTFTHTFDLDLNITPNTVPDGVAGGLFMTAPLSGGISRPPKSAFRLVTTLSEGSTEPLNISAAYFAKFGFPPQGSRIFFRFVYVTETGFAGTPLEDEVLPA